MGNESDGNDTMGPSTMRTQTSSNEIRNIDANYNYPPQKRGSNGIRRNGATHMSSTTIKFEGANPEIGVAIGIRT